MSQLPTIATQLTSEEENFVYNVEVLGLPARKSADMAGMPVGSMNKPHIMQAREAVKRELRGSLQITKDDIVNGYRDAIGRAQILGEPAVEIMGWEKIAKILGFDAAQKVDVNITASLDVLKTHVRTMSDDQLSKMLGADGIIDGDFYVVAPKD